MVAVPRFFITKGINFYEFTSKKSQPLIQYFQPKLTQIFERYLISYILYLICIYISIYSRSHFILSYHVLSILSYLSIYLIVSILSYRVYLILSCLSLITHSHSIFISTFELFSSTTGIGADQLDQYDTPTLLQQHPWSKELVQSFQQVFGLWTQTSSRNNKKRVQSKL